MEIDLLLNFKVASSRALGDSGGPLEVYMPVHRPDLFSFEQIDRFHMTSRRPYLSTKQ